MKFSFFVFPELLLLGNAWVWKRLQNGFGLRIIENYNIEFKFFSISVRAKGAINTPKKVATSKTRAASLDHRNAYMSKTTRLTMCKHSMNLSNLTRALFVRGNKTYASRHELKTTMQHLTRA